MVYVLNKIVTWGTSPLGILFVGIAVSWCLLKSRHVRLRVCGHWMRRLVVALVWVMSCGVMTRVMGIPLEVDEIDETILPKADAIVLLGGSMGVHAKCGRGEMFGAADRVWMAARLFKAGKAPKIFVTGRGNEESTLDVIVDFGVSTNALVFVGQARNTEEEAWEIARLVDCSITGRKPKVLLVTSAWHMKRAKMMFEKYAPGLDVVAAPTDYEMHCVAERPIEIGDFIPSVDALARNSAVLKEWVARIGYAAFR